MTRPSDMATSSSATSETSRMSCSMMRIEQSISCCTRPCSGEYQAARMRWLAECDQHGFHAGEGRQQTRVLEPPDEAESRPFVRGKRGDILAREDDRALIGRLVAGDDVEQRRLPGAVGAN